MTALVAAALLAAVLAGSVHAATPAWQVNRAALSFYCPAACVLYPSADITLVGIRFHTGRFKGGGEKRANTQLQNQHTPTLVQLTAKGRTWTLFTIPSSANFRRTGVLSYVAQARSERLAKPFVGAGARSGCRNDQNRSGCRNDQNAGPQLPHLIPVKVYVRTTA